VSPRSSRRCLTHSARGLARILSRFELLGRREERLDLVGFQERPPRTGRLEPPATTAGRVRPKDLVIDGDVEDRRQEAERLVDGLVAERTDTTTVGVHQRRARFDHVLDVLALGHLVGATRRRA
jgi:hypothetical protein